MGWLKSAADMVVALVPKLLLVGASDALACSLRAHGRGNREWDQGKMVHKGRAQLPQVSFPPRYLRWVSTRPCGWLCVLAVNQYELAKV